MTTATHTPGPWPIRPSPVRDRLVHLLRHEKASMTTVELAERMGKTNKAMSMTLSRLWQYGLVRKISVRRADGRFAHEMNRWELPIATGETWRDKTTGESI